ncbi:hypothetical protein [Microbacterium dauci]|uniref:Major tail protein n=1 Tax=Microbacterium dauci TaxID=3048008 RepID=A0ABT6ZGR0_9MICO|nr:hypothetical protein [Microbacterium sp. LX3-4]MDJ1115344.1 hypothetical protein [Microbacterium sp. LX3-4]
MTRTLGPGSLKIGETGSEREWAGHLTKTALVPSTSSDDPVAVLDGTEVAGEDTTTWALTGTILDNFEFDSLQNFAIANAGKEMPFVWTPNNDGGTDYSGTVRIRPIGIGGDVKKKNTNDLEFPLIGAPTPGELV